MTLEGGFTLQRSLPRRVAGGNTLVLGDLGWQMDKMEQPTVFFFSFFIGFHRLLIIVKNTYAIIHACKEPLESYF